jgi:hypothetical protein
MGAWRGSLGALNVLEVRESHHVRCRYNQQAVDKVRQRRSRGAQRLNVLQRVRVASSLAAALLDGLSEQPAMASEQICDYPCLLFLSCSIRLSIPC